MNVESSRSHLIVGIMVESRNLTNGSVSTGKLSLVDLAGSERAAKTGAKDHQLKVYSSAIILTYQPMLKWLTVSEKISHHLYHYSPLQEANSINKSLSALGDVISSLSAEMPHVPYRNSKLTQVMKKPNYISTVASLGHTFIWLSHFKFGPPQVMQDSLGGNAKTLMIVNISPSECNLDETLTSLL